jgi:hypothetical protein
MIYNEILTTEKETNTDIYSTDNSQVHNTEQKKPPHINSAWYMILLYEILGETKWTEHQNTS